MKSEPAAAVPVLSRADVEVSPGGDAAYALLRDAAFREAWDALRDACPWSTVCQSHAFADAWFASYDDQYEPLIVSARTADGNLAGLFVLATDRATGAIVHVGAQQAEYQVWLARPADADAFIEAALDALAQRFPGRSLVLQFVPPRVPLGWRSADRAWARKTLLIETPLPVLKLGPGSHVESSLKKKKNKSRMSALQRSGPVRLVQLTTRAELETVIDRVAEHYDFRQVVLSDTMPFRGDARKRRFLLSLIDHPGLLSAAVLMVGDDVAAANFGLIDGDTVGIGVLSHSPFYAEHSPGKLLVLLLGRDLSRQGYTRLDLTPGGALPKTRFADYSDTAAILEIHFDRARYLERTARSRVVNAGKSIVVAMGLDPDAVKTRTLALRQTLLAGGVRAVPRNALRLVGDALKGGDERLVYVLERSAAPAAAPQPALEVDSLPDLLAYRQRASGDPPPGLFLLEAQNRLRAGAHVYTLTEGGELVHRAWLATRPAHETGAVLYPAGSAVAWDDFTRPAADRSALRERSILQRVHDALRTPAVERVFIEFAPADAPGRAAAESLGLKYYGATGTRRGRRTAPALEHAAASRHHAARPLGRLWLFAAAVCTLFSWFALG